MSKTQNSNTTIDIRTQRLVLLLVCLGSFMSPFTLSAVNIAIPSMARDLQADAISISWMPTLFLLANVSLILPFSKLADNYGRKRIYVGGLVISALASFGAAMAPSIEVVLAFRFFQGIASAMIFGSGMALITSVFANKSRGLPLGLNTASIYFGLTMAPFFGGWLTENFSWRAVFFAPVILAMVLVFIATVLIKSDWKKDLYSRFDFTGSIIFAGWAFAFVIGVSLITDMRGAALLVLSAGLMAWFIYYQSQHPEPLIRVQLFVENRMFGRSLASAFFMYASNYPTAFLLSLYLQYVRGLSAMDAGKVLLAQAVAMACLAPFSGKFSDRVDPRILTTLGCIFALIGFFLLSRLNETTETLWISAALFFVGIGFGLFSSPNHNAVVGSVGEGDIGVAAASLNLARVCGNILAISIATALIHVLIGNQVITVDNYPAVMKTVHIGISVSMAFVVCAILCSISRGKKAS